MKALALLLSSLCLVACVASVDSGPVPDSEDGGGGGAAVVTCPRPVAMSEPSEGCEDTGARDVTGLRVFCCD